MTRTTDIAGDLVPTADRPEIRAGFVGCGSHAFRNIYPTLQFAPVDLVATCDLDEERAAAFAEQFGAERSYADHRAMLDGEDLDAVFAVVGYDDDGRPLYPEIASDAMRAGCDVWIEKPPAASTETIRELMRVEAETDRFVHVGYKKVYAPAVEKVKEITDREEFGDVDTLYVRYPTALPDRDDPDETLTHDPSLVSLLDHVVHPGSIASYLGGPIDRVHHRSSQRGGFVTLEFESGAVGTIHMAAGSSGGSPLERLEIVGDNANVVVDNGIDLTYYRPYDRGGPYGRTPTFTGGEGHAPVRWMPEFSLGQLYNKNLFAQGYFGEIRDFAESCLDGTPPGKAGLEMSLELLELYEALLQGENRVVEL